MREIARRVGYEDPFYFDRVFRRYHDMTPRDYRRRLRSEGHKTITFSYSEMRM
ncbi:MAG: AraC family transcriptional regulator [Merdibacter sp.]